MISALIPTMSRTSEGKSNVEWTMVTSGRPNPTSTLVLTIVAAATHVGSHLRTT
jgi:hypothetical protein